MKKTLFLAGILILSIVLSGCGKGQGKQQDSEQDKVVISYFKALAAGKIDEAVSYYSKNAKAEMEKAGGKQPLAAAFNQVISIHKGIKNIEIVKREMSSDTTKVMFLYKFNDGSTSNGMIVLAKEDNAWKIFK